LRFASAALAQEIEPLLKRPVTLPSGALDLTLHGTYTNLASGATPGSEVPSTFTGATLAFGVDYGAGDRVQLGLAVALPIDPAVGFGSVLASTAFALNQDAGQHPARVQVLSGGSAWESNPPRTPLSARHRF
jgi:hypothetical protein